jgi:predicted  nucleic acid-binding Zn-ribbon protein
MAGQAENIKTLEAHIETLQADIVAAHENFESLRSSSDQSSAEAAAAAQMEREAFLRAKADVETVTAEVNSLRAAHDRALEEASAMSSESQQRAAEAISLTAQIGELKTEREESAAKISELEVEILELKESQEDTEDEHKRTLDHLQRLEAELAGAVAATQQALRDAEARDAESTQKAADVALLHADEVQLIKSDLANAISEVEALKTELAAAHVAHDETRAAAHASAEAREEEMEEAEQSYLSKHIELSEEIKRLTIELEVRMALVFECELLKYLP